MLSITLLINLAFAGFATQGSSFDGFDLSGWCQHLDLTLERKEYTSVNLNGETILNCGTQGSLVGDTQKCALKCAEGFILEGGVLAMELYGEGNVEVSVDIRYCENGQWSGPLECLPDPDYCTAELSENTVGLETTFVPACVDGGLMAPGSTCFFTCDHGYTYESFNTDNGGILRCHEGNIIEETTTGNAYPGCFPACRAPLEGVSKNLWYTPGDVVQGCVAESEGSQCNPDGIRHTCKFGSHDGLLKINKCGTPGGDVELECEPIICDDEMSSDQCGWAQDNFKMCEAFPDESESEDPFGLKESYQSFRSECQKTCGTCDVNDNPAVCRIPDYYHTPEGFIYEDGIEDFRLDNCFHLTDPSACELPPAVKCAEGFGGTPIVSDTCSIEGGEVTLAGCKPSVYVALPAVDLVLFGSNTESNWLPVYVRYEAAELENDFTADWVVKNVAGVPIHFGSTTFQRQRAQDWVIILPNSLPEGTYTVNFLESSTNVYLIDPDFINAIKFGIHLQGDQEGVDTGRLRRLIEVENQGEGEKDDRRKL